MSTLKVMRLFLFDPQTGRDVVELFDGMSINAAALARCTLRPEIAGGATGRVLWVIDGRTLCREFDAPFCPAALLVAAALQIGARTIRAVPYAPPNAASPTGAIGTSRTVHINIVADAVKADLPSLPAPADSPMIQTSGGNMPAESGRPRPLLIGLCADTIDPQYAGPAVRDLGARGMRLWCSMRDGQDPPADKFAQAKFYKSLGMKVVLCCTGATLGDWYTPLRISAWFERAVALAGGAVDAWEIGNEPNLRQYNAWDETRYVRDFVAPASATLRGRGQRIYGPSVTADVAYMRRLIDRGLLPLIDVMNVHVYQPTVAAHVALLKRFRDLTPHLPLVQSEFNIMGHLAKPPMTAQQWAYQIGPLFDGVRGILDEGYLFILNTHPESKWGASLLNTDARPPVPIEPMYSAVKKAIRTNQLISQI